MPVYVIADVKVTDDSWLPAYATEFHDIVHMHGRKYLPVAAFAGCQFHGNNSSRREAGCSAMRASTSTSHAC